MVESVAFGFTKEFRDRFQQALDERDKAFIQGNLEGRFRTIYYYHQRFAWVGYLFPNHPFGSVKGVLCS